ncbi:hypothetical protein HAX54_042957 [Datura stramonium]|uniref:Uncharacterized protein n=1 Tax=Datura stramonium TaxID=4076 RepID=A0ABS8SMG3_DATST|nr:hypothetical protein [Datura stramonium]
MSHHRARYSGMEFMMGDHHHFPDEKSKWQIDAFTFCLVIMFGTLNSLWTREPLMEEEFELLKEFAKESK